MMNHTLISSKIIYLIFVSILIIMHEILEYRKNNNGVNWIKSINLNYGIYLTFKVWCSHSINATQKLDRIPYLIFSLHAICHKNLYTHANEITTFSQINQVL